MDIGVTLCSGWFGKRGIPLMLYYEIPKMAFYL